MVIETSRLSTAQWVLERQLAWITLADAKVGAVVTISLAMLGGLGAAFSANPTRSQWTILFSTVAAILLVASLICAACTLKPRLDGPPQSLLFFGRVAEFTNTFDYVMQFKDATPDGLLEDWTQQIHRNAQIAFKKHHWTLKAMIWSFIAAIFWVIAIGSFVK